MAGLDKMGPIRTEHSAVTANTQGTPFNVERIHSTVARVVATGVTTGFDVTVYVSDSEDGTYTQVLSMTENIAADGTFHILFQWIGYTMGWARIDVANRTDGTVTIQSRDYPFGSI